MLAANRFSTIPKVTTSSFFRPQTNRAPYPSPKGLPYSNGFVIILREAMNSMIAPPLAFTSALPPAPCFTRATLATPSTFWRIKQYTGKQL